MPAKKIIRPGTNSDFFYIQTAVKHNITSLSLSLSLSYVDMAFWAHSLF